MLYVYLVLMFLLRWSICSGETTRDERFCENGQDFQLNCSQNEVISNLSVTSGGYRIDPSKRSNCTNTSKCTISTDIFSSIRKITICIYTEYYCDCFPKSYVNLEYACLDSLEQIACHWGLFCDITITEVIVLSKTGCPSSNCNVNSMVKELCNKKRACKNPKDDACLFHPRFVNIHYSCKGDSYLSLTETSSKPFSPSILTQVKDTTTEFSDGTTTYSFDVNSTVNEMSQPVVLLDVDGRVVIYSSSENKNGTICGIGWDDKDATVICRCLYSSSSGHAKWVTSYNNSNYDTIPYAIHCNGNETDLFLCSYEYLQYGCNTSNVAAVVCNKDKNTTNQSSRYDEHNALLNKPDVAVAVGVSVGVIVLICIAVTVFLLVKRSRPTKKDALSSSNITNGDYIERQAITLTSNPNISKHAHSNANYDHNYRRNDINSHNVSSRNNFSSPTYSATALETRTIKTEQVNGGYEYTKSIGEEMHNASGDTYACSEDGVYDKAKNNRHVQTELNVYSHSIDTVYDTSERNRNKEHTIDTYDHFFGQKNDKNYDIAMRK